VAIESAADRLSFLSPDEFGERATYTIAGGSVSASLVGVFNNPFLTVLEDDVGTSDARPTFVCRAADLPAGARGGDAGDALAIEANDLHAALSYLVADLQPDGAGMVRLTLANAA
jgi:hypothetical protein